MIKNYPVTPDGRYFVVKKRLWRCSNPSLSPEATRQLVDSLMSARRAKGLAMRRKDKPAREAAKKAIDDVKQKLGERGPVWWKDGSPDLNRHMVRNSPYAVWFDQLPDRLKDENPG